MSEEDQTERRPPRLYELAERRVAPVNEVKTTDPITRFLDQEDEETIREIKRLKLKTVEKRYREELGEDGREKEQEMTQKETVSISPELVKELAKLPDEEREKAVDVYQRLTLAHSMKGDAAMFMLPMIMGAQRANPGSSVSEIASVTEKMMSAMKMGADISGGKQQGYDPIALMNAAVDLAQKFQPAQQGGPPSDPLESTFGMLDKLDSMGLLKKSTDGAPAPNDDMVKIELEKLRSNTALQLKELDLKYGTEAKRLDNEKAKVDIFGDGMVKIARAAGHAFGQGEEEAEESTQAAPPPRPRASPDIDYLECTECPKLGKGKTMIPIPEPNKPRVVKCPTCGSEFNYAPAR